MHTIRAHVRRSRDESEIVRSRCALSIRDKREHAVGEGTDRPRTRFMLKIIAIALVAAHLMEPRVLLTHKDDISASDGVKSATLSNPTL